MKIFLFVLSFVCTLAPGAQAFDFGKAFNILSSSVKVIKSLTPMGKNEEKAIGEATSLRLIAGNRGIVVNNALTKYVSLVGNSIVLHSDFPRDKFYFAVLNSNDINAFAAPGGFIFITRGVLSLVENEAQLAGVIAHEIAHVQKKHMVNTIKRAKFLQGARDISINFMKKEPAFFDKVVNMSTDVLLNKGLDRDLEYEADAVGLDYAYRTGYNPAGLIKFLEKLSGEQQATSIFFSTHPSASDRIQRLNNVLRTKYSDGKNLPVLAGRFKEALKK